MCEGASSDWNERTTQGCKSNPNSLFWNILRITLLVPIFCEPKNRPEAAKSFKSNILRYRSEKTNEGQRSPNRCHPPQPTSLVARFPSPRVRDSRVFSGCKLIQVSYPHNSVLKGIPHGNARSPRPAAHKPAFRSICY